MQVALPLEEMTTKEKLRVIEDVWDNLCHSNAEIPSPEWHGDVLRKREEMVQNGAAKFLDLDEAKRRLKERLS